MASASAAEQLAANMSFGLIGKAKDLQSRIWFTLGALIVYRIGTYMPIPGIDSSQISLILEQTQQGVIGLFNLFSGGAVGRLAIFALNILPYISASIIVQLMTAVYPPFEALKKDGEAGRKTLNQYTRYGTVLLAAVQSYGIAVGLEATEGLVINEGWFFRISTVITLTGGTMFLVWLGEQITARGLGNGISLLIYAGIVAGLPGALFSLLEQGRAGAVSWIFVLLVLVGAAGLIALVVFVERAQRRILIQYPKRQVGRRMYDAQSSHLPLKINTAGVIPPIFATSLLLVPATLSAFVAGNAGDGGILFFLSSFLGRGAPAYVAIYVVLIMFFALFYTSIVFNPADTAENLKKNGAFVPGIRPGDRTADYIDYVLTRITCFGAVYLAFVCAVPEFFLFGASGLAFALGGTSLLIVVSVTLDTVSQIQGYLVAHQYENLMTASRLGRRRKK